MKCITISILIVILTGIVLLSSCVDFHAGKRPIDYDNTKWISSEPDIWFTVHDRECIGEIKIDDLTSEIIVLFDYGAEIEFCDINDNYQYYNNYLFRGKCEFNKNKLIVKVTENDKGFLDDSIKEIVFVREDITE